MIKQSNPLIIFKKKLSKMNDNDSFKVQGLETAALRMWDCTIFIF